MDHALSDDDEAFSLDFADRFARVDSLTMPELSPLDDVASAPFRWDAAPQMAPRPGSLVFVQSPALSEAEQRRLISLAMGQGPPKGSWGAGGLDGLPAVGQATAMAPHPRPTHLQQQIQGGAAASSSSSASAPGSGQNDKGLDDGGKPKNTERAAHNDIERKYRTNLKDKIAELRDAVPALSIAGAEGEQGGGAPPKVSKVRAMALPSRYGKGPPSPLPEEAVTANGGVEQGTVLTKATEYIRHLERRNRSITQQHQELSRRVQAFEQLLTPTTRANFRGPQDCNIVDS